MNTINILLTKSKGACAPFFVEKYINSKAKVINLWGTNYNYRNYKT